MRIVILSGFIFFIYGASLFVVFLLAANFHDYRAMLSQLSGAFNAMAALLLTFYIEPKLSLAADSEDGTFNGYLMILSLLVGRMLGVGLVGTLFFFMIAVMHFP